MKDHRVKMLREIMEKMKEVQTSYEPASSGWVLLQASWGHVMSLHHLESETHFSDKTLGVKDD